MTPAPLSHSDIVPFCAWWAAGAAVGFIACLPVAWFTGIDSIWPSLLVLAGGIAGMDQWWRRRL